MTDLFFRHLSPEHGDTFLDLAGPTRHMSQITSYFQTAIAMNIEAERYETDEVSIKFVQDGGSLVYGDSRSMPLKDRSVDWVLCNAMFEHISPKEQPAAAAEIKRVARKGYLIITPYLFFPIEIHCGIPFAQFLPKPLRFSILRIFCGPEWLPLWLPRKTTFRNLFPEANVGGLSLLGAWAGWLTPENIYASFRGVEETMHTHNPASVEDQL